MTSRLPTVAAAPPAAADPWLPQSYEVRVHRRDSADTFTVGLARQGGGESMAFAPGQFNMLYAFGVGEAAISISGDPARRDLLWHTIRSVGGVTGQLSRLRRGEPLLLRGPYGRGWPLQLPESSAAPAPDYLIIAGGIGLAPLRPALLHLERHRQRYGQLALLLGARTPADLLFQRDLSRWHKLGIQVEITVDRPDSEWRGDVGLVTALLKRLALRPERTTALICGPEIMMRSCHRELRQRGLSDGQIFVTMERNMSCAIGHCGHCQLGPKFICKDGPVFSYAEIGWLIEKREL